MRDVTKSFVPIVARVALVSLRRALPSQARVKYWWPPRVGDRSPVGRVRGLRKRFFSLVSCAGTTAVSPSYLDMGLIMTVAVELQRGTLLFEVNLVDVPDVIQDAEGNVKAGEQSRPLDGTCLHPLASLAKLKPPGVMFFVPPGGVEKPAANLVTIDGAQVLLAPSKLESVPRKHGKHLWPFIWRAISGCGDSRETPPAESWEVLRGYSATKAAYIADYVRSGAHFVSQFRTLTLGELRKEVGSEYPLAHSFRTRFARDNHLLDTEYGREFLSSVLCADTVYFHSQDQADAFCETVKKLIGNAKPPYAQVVEICDEGIVVQDPGPKGGRRLVKASANPIAIEVKTERAYAQAPETTKEVDRLRELTINPVTGEQRRVVLINGRCEDRKNVLAMVEAYLAGVEDYLSGRGGIDPQETALYVRTSADYDDDGKIAYAEQEEIVTEVRKKIKALNDRMQEAIGTDAVIFDPTPYNNHERTAQASVADVHLFVSAKNSPQTDKPKEKQEGMEGYGTSPLSVLAVNPAVRCVLGPEQLTPITKRLGEVAVIADSASAEDIKVALVHALAPESDSKRKGRTQRTREISDERTAEDWLRALGVMIHPLPPQAVERRRGPARGGPEPRLHHRLPTTRMNERTLHMRDPAKTGAREATRRGF